MPSKHLFRHIYMNKLAFVNRIVFVLVLFAFCLSTNIVVAQNYDEGFTIDGNMFARGEIRAGGFDSKTNNTDAAAFVLDRARIIGHYQNRAFSMHLAIQHVGVWGSDDRGAVKVFEGWAQFYSQKGWFVKLGRQTLSYDDERIIGSCDWSVMGTSYDVAKVGMEKQHHKVHIILAFNQNDESFTGGTYYNNKNLFKTMQTAWYHFDVPNVPIGLSVIGMNIGMQDSTNQGAIVRNQQLLGGYANFSPSGLKVEVSYYHQLGENEKGIPIDAWMAAIRAEKTIGSKWAVYGGYDYLSGDDKFPVPGEGEIGLIQHKVIKGFKPLYGSQHKFYGAMSFFYLNTYINNFTPGLQNLYAGAKWNPLKSLNVDMGYHFYATASKLDNHSSDLGHALELEIGWRFHDYAKLSFGYSLMRGTSTMEALQRVNSDRYLRWGWLQLMVSPRIFTSSSK